MTSSSRSRTRRLAVAGCLLIPLVVAGCSSSGYVWRPNFFVDSLLRPNSAIINGLMLTVVVSIVAQAIGVVLGVFAAMGKMARLLPLRAIAAVYVWIFRGTPLLVQLSFFYFGFPNVGLFRWPGIDLGPIVILPEILAGTIIMGVNEGAYMAEIVRAGIIAVDPGQTEAAKSLGMTYGQTMRRIVLPQAARVIIPPLGNEFNNMLKTTSLLIAVSVFELYNTFSNFATHEFAPFEFFGACAIWYLILTTIWAFFQARIERRFGRGTGTSTTDGGLTARLLGFRNASANQVGAR